MEVTWHGEINGAEKLYLSGANKWNVGIYFDSPTAIYNSPKLWEVHGLLKYYFLPAKYLNTWSQTYSSIPGAAFSTLPR